MFSFYILTFCNNENPSKDIYLLYLPYIKLPPDHAICEYMGKIFQDPNDINIDRNASEN